MKKILLTVLAAVLTALPLQAASFASTSTDVGTNLSYIIAPVRAGTPVLRYVNVTSDKAASVLKFYSAGAASLVTTNVDTGTNYISVAGTGTFNTNDVVIIRSVSGDTYQRLTVGEVSAQQIVVSTNVNFALPAGSTIYIQSAAGTIPVGNTTKEITQPCWSGMAGMPLLFEVDGTSACQINAAYITYE